MELNNLVISGVVVTTPRDVVTQDGLRVVTFRLANPYGENTNWLTASMFGSTAELASEQIKKGYRVTLNGKLIVRDWDNGERSGTSVEIEVKDFQVNSKRDD